jgi:hypothetical protein
MDRQGGRHGGFSHYFIVSGEDIVDFSVGDWQDAETLTEFVILGVPPLPPICWTAPPPQFFWAHRDNFTPRPPAPAPAINQAWYLGYGDDTAFFPRLVTNATPTIKSIMPRLAQGIKQFALRERLAAYLERPLDECVVLSLPLPSPPHNRVVPGKSLNGWLRSRALPRS